MDWPVNVIVQQRNGRLVVTDVLGTVKMGEGDEVRLGGGEVADGLWGVCGLMERA